MLKAAEASAIVIGGWTLHHFTKECQSVESLVGDKDHNASLRGAHQAYELEASELSGSTLQKNEKALRMLQVDRTEPRSQPGAHPAPELSSGAKQRSQAAPCAGRWQHCQVRSGRGSWAPSAPDRLSANLKGQRVESQNITAAGPSARRQNSPTGAEGHPLPGPENRPT